ncbi:MAG: TatD family hydrolase [Bacteroidales bacterium]|nr:TatD family hydrolase [Bacteroidales bacterium]
MLVDTHCHLYLPEFKQDLDDTILRAKNSGISKIILPNIDSKSIDSMFNLYYSDTNLFSIAIGLHPRSVKEDYELELLKIFKHSINIIGIGEIGIDLYWDKTFLKEQQVVFDFQLNYACENNLPVIIHSRNSLKEVLDIVKLYLPKGLKGVFHCFPGNLQEAKQIINYGFYLGIGGILSYKKNNMLEVVENIDLEFILTETDSPYLSPVPYRGKRNEPSYMFEIVKLISSLKKIDYDDVANITKNNAIKLFNF